MSGYAWAFVLWSLMWLVFAIVFGTGGGSVEPYAQWILFYLRIGGVVVWLIGVAAIAVGWLGSSRRSSDVDEPVDPAPPSDPPPE